MVNDTAGRRWRSDNPPRMIAVIGAKGSRAAKAPIPTRCCGLRWSHSAEKALAGSGQNADPGARVIADLKDGLKLSSFAWHKPIPEAEVSGYREVILNIIEGPNGESFRINGRTYDHNRIDAVLPLGKAEEWRAAALIEDHPLHIHVNPFQIISIEDPKGSDVTDPKSPAFDPDYAGLKGEWKDTVFIKKDMRDRLPNPLRALHRRLRHPLPHHVPRRSRHDAESAHRCGGGRSDAALDALNLKPGGSP